jgi:hypothetical protein
MVPFHNNDASNPGRNTMPKSTKATLARIERDMTNHPPSGPTQARMEEVRKKYKGVAAELHGFGQSREASLAITNLEQSLMWAMAHLARNAYDASLSAD